MRLGGVLRELGRSSGRASINRKRLSSTLLIEAGAVGWTSVFYSELFETAREYISDEAVYASKIDRSKMYVKQAISNLNRTQATHYVYDPRTGSQNPFLGLVQTLVIAFYLGLKDVTPIFMLTDGSVRQWRYQAFILTAKSGVIVTFLNPKEMPEFFPHERVIGPMIMPVSKRTFQVMLPKSKTKSPEKIDCTKVYFLGSLYQRRLTFFKDANQELLKRGCKSQLLFEEKTSTITSDNYWQSLTKYDCLVTTTFQAVNPKYKMAKKFFHILYFVVLSYFY
jgi:hypothetical protein